MNKIVLAALAATTLAGPVLAQNYNHDRRELHQDRAELRGDRHELRQDARNGDHREYRQDARELRDDRHDYRDDRRDYRSDRQDAWSHGNRGHDEWRGRGNDWRWDGDRYRAARYYYPRGYSYRTWNVGINLAPAYFGSRYWINDWSSYRLIAPAYGTRWVRVGPDALLIRIRDGYIVRAVRGLYY